MTNTAPQSGKAQAADCIVYLRLPAGDVEAAERFAEEEVRTKASFLRAMVRRGLDDYKAKRAALSAPVRS